MLTLFGPFRDPPLSMHCTALVLRVAPSYPRSTHHASAPVSPGPLGPSLSFSLSAVCSPNAPTASATRATRDHARTSRPIPWDGRPLWGVVAPAAGAFSERLLS